jgi:hypothetical protein
VTKTRAIVAAEAIGRNTSILPILKIDHPSREMRIGRTSSNGMMMSKLDPQKHLAGYPSSRG